MNIEHNPEQKHFFLLDEQNHSLGHIEYMRGDDGNLYAIHTEVYPQYEGHGYAGQLLDILVAYAQELDVKIVPICSYVTSAFEKYPQKYASVI